MTSSSPQHAPPQHAGVEPSGHPIFRDSLELGVKFDLWDLELDDFSSVVRVAHLVATSAKGAA